MISSNIWEDVNGMEQKNPFILLFMSLFFTSAIIHVFHSLFSHIFKEIGKEKKKIWQEKVFLSFFFSRWSCFFWGLRWNDYNFLKEAWYSLMQWWSILFEVLDIFTLRQFFSSYVPRSFSVPRKIQLCQ